MDINTLIEVILVTREKVSKKSMFFVRLNPFATNLALYLSADPSGLSFFL